MELIVPIITLFIILFLTYIGYVVVWFIGYACHLVYVKRFVSPCINLPMPIVERIYNPIDFQASFRIPDYYPPEEKQRFIEYATKRNASDLGVKLLESGCIEVEHPEHWDRHQEVRMRLRVYKQDR